LYKLLPAYTQIMNLLLSILYANQCYAFINGVKTIGKSAGILRQDIIC